MKKTIEWKLASGKKAEYTIALNLEKEINADGDKVKVPCCDIKETIDIEGHTGFISAYIEEKRGTASGIKYVAVIGGKVAISEDIYSQIRAAKSEIESTPEWIKKVEKDAQNLKEIAEYEAHRSKMQKMMGC